MSSNFTNVAVGSKPKAKFTRHHVHEVVSSLTEAKHIANDFANVNRYVHRATVSLVGSPNIRPYDPIYLDGLPNGLSGYWTVLSVRHIFGGQPFNYIMEVEVGTDYIGDINPNAASASEARNVKSELANQALTISTSSLINTGSSINGTVLITADPQVVGPATVASATAIPSSVATTPFSLSSPNFSSASQTLFWGANSTSSVPVNSAPSKNINSFVLSGASWNDFTVVNNGLNRPYNNGSAVISITLSSTGGSPVTSYVVTPSPATVPATFTSTTPEITVTNLASNTSYTYSVGATNLSGLSVYNNSVGTLATTVPAAPTVGTVTKTAYNTITLAFTAGATGGSAITSYVVTATPEVSDILTTGTTSPLTVTGTFAKKQSYTFTVAAVNVNGTSANSSASAALTTLGAQVMSNSKVYFMKG